MKNLMQLKAFCKNLGEKTGIPAQVVLQNYIIERILERIAASRFRTRLILKGGVLVSSTLGLDVRTTMDLDLSARQLLCSSGRLKTVFDEICAIDVEDSFSFVVSGAEEIRVMDKYPSIRLTLRATFMSLHETVKIDVTSGDKITPKEQMFEKRRLFQEGSFQICAYNIETVLAEKLETILSRSTQNTRLRDYYDVYVLANRKHAPINLKHLRLAFLATTQRRGTTQLIEAYSEIIENIHADKTMAALWMKYGKAFPYAAEISFRQVCGSVKRLLASILEPPSKGQSK